MVHVKKPWPIAVLLTHLDMTFSHSFQQCSGQTHGTCSPENKEAVANIKVFWWEDIEQSLRPRALIWKRVKTLHAPQGRLQRIFEDQQASD